MRFRLPWKTRGKKPDEARRFPPVPNWQPEFGPSPEQVVETFSYYTDEERDFAVLKNGTIVELAKGVADTDVPTQVNETIAAIYNRHPDMSPQTMDDGNILVAYNYPAFNIAFEEIASAYWRGIDKNHLEALCTDEVLMSNLGANVFDDFGKKALWARCYFFMDAHRPEVIEIVRNAA